MASQGGSKRGIELRLSYALVFARNPLSSFSEPPCLRGSIPFFSMPPRLLFTSLRLRSSDASVRAGGEGLFEGVGGAIGAPFARGDAVLGYGAEAAATGVGVDWHLAARRLG